MAKYIKGSFTVIPNKEILRGKPSGLQAVYFWIVSYSNEYGECFPSRNLIASDAGVDIKTVDKYIPELIKLGILSKKNRTNRIEKLTNLYQIEISEDEGVAPKTGVGTPKNGATPTPKNGALTISNINSIQLNCEQSSRPPKSKKKDYTDQTPLSREQFVNSMKSSPQKHIQIIGEWAECEAPEFTKKGEWYFYIDRNVKAANQLIAFEISSIEKAYEKMLKDVKSEKNPKGFITKYTLETLAKYII